MKSMSDLNLLVLLLIGIFFICTTTLLSGQNLVVNPGFEEYSICPSETNQVNRSIGWQVALGSPDYYNRCAEPTTGLAQSVEVPINYHGNQEPFAGDAYAGYFTVGEYLVGQFISPLIADSCYYVEFQVSLAEFTNRDFSSCDRFGLYFSEAVPNSNIAASTPQLTILDIPTNFDTWTVISGFYTASGGENFMTIGGFDLCAPRSFYYVDNFNVMPSNIEQDTVYHCFESDGCYNIAGNEYCDPGEYLITLGSIADGDCSNTYTLFLIDSEVPVIINETPDFDCDEGSYTLSIDTEIPSTGSIVEWSGPGSFTSSELSPKVTQPGTYYLSLSIPGSSCFSRDSIIIASDGGETIDVVIDDVMLTCETPIITLDPESTVAGLEYSWTGPGIDASTSTIDVMAEGMYTLTLNAAGYCERSVTIMVTDLRTLTGEIVTSDIDSICDLSIKDILVQAKANEVDVTYRWSNGSIESSILVDDSGSYSVTITSEESTCTYVETVVIQRPPSISIIKSTDIDCENSTSTLTANTSITGLTYDWVGPSFSSADSIIIVDQPGMYVVSIFDPMSGCSVIDSVTISQDLTPIISEVSKSGDLDCNTNEVNLSVTTSLVNALYNWSGPNGFSASGEDSESISITEQGNYSVTISNASGTCTDVRSIIVDMIGDDPDFSIDKSNDLNCTEENSELAIESASEDLSIVWSGISGELSKESSVIVDKPGIYMVVVTNDAGCSSTKTTEVRQTDITNAIGSSTQGSCSDEFGSILIEGIEGGIEPYSYSVDGGGEFASSSVFDNLESGTYELVVKDASDCQYRIGDIDIDEFITPSVSLPEAIFIEENESLILTAIVSDVSREIISIEWTGDAELSCDDCLSPSITSSVDTELSVVITFSDDCQAEAVVQIIINEQEVESIFFPTVFSGNALNSLNQKFHPFSSLDNNSTVSHFKIYDRWGSLVYEANNFLMADAADYGWDGIIRGKKANLGVYLYIMDIELPNGIVRQLKGTVKLI